MLKRLEERLLTTGKFNRSLCFDKKYFVCSLCSLCTFWNHRVNGLLAISRAFGDTQFKPDKDDSNCDPQQEGLVISTPEVYSEIITPMTEFAVMATDGLWDVMTAQMAVTFVRNMLHKHRDLEEAARGLTKEALNLGSVDNVTVLIISFHYSDEGKIKSAK